MKNLIIACLLFSGWGMAQNITFQDQAVKLNVISKFDKNSDQEIDLSEAQSVDTLYLYDYQANYIGGFSDLVNFPNINTLIINAVLIDSVNLNFLNNLTHFEWHLHKKVKSLDLNPTSINTLEFWQGEDKTSLTDLNLSKYPNVLKFYFEDLLIGDIKFDFWPKLNELSINNNITADSVTKSIDLLQNPELKTLYLRGYSAINSIDISQNVNLTGVLFGNFPLLESLDLSKNSELRTLLIYSTNLKLKSIDLSLNSKLNNVDFMGLTNIQSLDFSNCNQINRIWLYNLDSLKYLNIKNGLNEELRVDNCKKLKYICSDEEQLKVISDSLKFYSIFAEVNSNCSFTPGGLYNTITSNLKFDAKGNCTGNDTYLSYTKFSIENQNGKGISVTDNQGIVNFYKQKGNYTLTPELENSIFFLISPQTTSFKLLDDSNHDTTINFCITPRGFHKDLEVILAPWGPARPGFDAKYLVTYKNKGNQTLSGDINVKYNEDVLDFVSSNMKTHVEGNVSTTFIDLKPFEVRVDTLVLNVNSPTETPAVNINDTLNFNATINPTNEDETPTDNVFELNQRVVGAYDPNLITCLQGNELKPTEIGKTLYYTIEFENTGNYPAENIVVVEEIDPTKYDLNSLQILNTSHPMKFRVEGNKVEYYFDKIQLGEHKHGNILLKLNSNDALIEGSEVTKQANIYFDYNAPVQTNNEKTVYRDLKASIVDLNEDLSINVYPNPGKGNVNVSSAKNIKSIEVYDVNGRVLQTKVVSSIQTEINLSDEITGVYFIKVTTEEGANVIKYQKD